LAIIHQTNGKKLKTEYDVEEYQYSCTGTNVLVHMTRKLKTEYELEMYQYDCTSTNGKKLKTEYDVETSTVVLVRMYRYT
jgi:hypothetical protein